MATLTFQTEQYGTVVVHYQVKRYPIDKDLTSGDKYFDWGPVFTNGQKHLVSGNADIPDQNGTVDAPVNQHSLVGSVTDYLNLVAETQST